MNIKVQRILLWTGPAMLVLWLIAFVFLCEFIPNPSPEKSPEDVVEMFRDDTNVIRFGLMITLFASALLVPFAALISSQMQRIEGFRSPLASTQLCSAALLSLEFIIPVMVWQTAAYRPTEESARMIQMLNDMGWLMFIGVVSSLLIQLLALGMVILMDDRPVPVLPRWYGYYNVWAALLISPAGLVPLFKDGPFAWNGIFSWYIPLVVWSSWMFVTFYVLRRAINEEEAEAKSAPAPAFAA